MHSLTVRLDSDNIERKDIAAALRKLLRHRHPEVAFTVRTPNYSMASDIDIRPKEDRRWNEAEAAVLRAVLELNLTIIGNEASFDPRKRVHKGGVEVGPSYLEDFRLFLAGKKPTRKPAKNSRQTQASEASLHDGNEIPEGEVRHEATQHLGDTHAHEEH